jgi:hypothetical protein
LFVDFNQLRHSRHLRSPPKPHYPPQALCDVVGIATGAFLAEKMTFLEMFDMHNVF